MIKLNYAVACVAGGILLLSISGAAAEKFHIPASDLKTALDNYAAQTGVELVVSSEAVRGVMTKGASGDLSDEDALKRILAGTGFVARHEAHAIVVVHDERAMEDLSAAPKIAAAPVTSVSGAALETVTVTSSKIGGDVQNIPISITALSQEQLTATQTAGGPDLIKQVPNMTFTKTNFSGYSIQLRGIGTQAISVTTDPAVAVAFNDIPFIRNHFFEQEFYDVSQVEVLRGPQGTLYGRNATAGVVNLISAKPSDQFEAMASADIGNYQNRRLEAMINIPVLDDRFDIRIAGEWTKRNGYTFNASTDKSVDGRDLWSGRVTLAYKPTENLQTTLVWEHFSEDDDRMRTAKQLCKTVQPPAEIKGQSGSYSFDEQVPPPNSGANGGGALYLNTGYLSQSCQMTSLYSADAFEVPYGLSLPYVVALGADKIEYAGFDPYTSTTQSRNLRVIDTALNPVYKAKNDTLELNADYAVTPSLTFTSQTGYNQDFLYSTEDYNRFDTTPGIFSGGGISLELAAHPNPAFVQQLYHLDSSGLHVLTCAITNDTGCPTGTQLGTPCTAGSPTPSDTACSAAYQFCDPQLGCSDRLVVQDLSDEHAWQLSQEFRLVSNFSGPFNFSVGGNYLHYETEENYYVFSNALTAYAYGLGTRTAQPPSNANLCVLYNGAYQYPNPIAGGGNAESICGYVDQNPLGSIDNKGHNYFLSQNPYTLNSYAGFGEAYYNIASDLKLTGGLRWTEDQKHFTDIPSELLTNGYGYYTTGVVNQQWSELTGRAVANWTPKLDFTDQTLIYGSYARGYKAGGANPPGAIYETIGGNNVEPDHPLTFKPEFINAFELGSKNTLLDGALTLNGDVFYYDYKDYQISEIVDRTSINLNFSSTVKGAELESSYEPVPGLRFNFAGGWEDTRIDNGQSAIDLMDRTAGMPGWMVVKPFVTDATNCILPDYVVATLLYEGTHDADGSSNNAGVGPYGCTVAYTNHLDPVTIAPYMPNPASPSGTGQQYIPDYAGYYAANFPDGPGGYPGFNPTQPAINNGEGFAKNLGGNKLPNAPPFTVSFGAQYTMPITSDWAGTLRGDYYWQDYSWARVFNDNPYDRLRGYTNVNLTLIFTNQNGWQVMLYDKNVFNETAITGDFLNSDDSGLTTNVFLTDPKLIGIRVTKNW